MLLALALSASFVIDGGDREAMNAGALRMAVALPGCYPEVLVEAMERQERLRAMYPTPPKDCAAAWRSLEEARRIWKNVGITFGLGVAFGFLDAHSTGYVDNKRALGTCPPGAKVCFVEWNRFAPDLGTLVAVKGAWITGLTGVEYIFDRLVAAPRGWRWPRWVFRSAAVLQGLVPAIINYRNAGKVDNVERAPAQ